MPCIGIWLYFAPRPFQLEKHNGYFVGHGWDDSIFLLLYSWESAKSCWSRGTSIPGWFYSIDLSLSLYCLCTLHYHLPQEHSVTLFPLNLSRQEKVNLILSLVWKKEAMLWLTLWDISPLSGTKTKTSMLMCFVKSLSRNSYSFYRGLKPINHMEFRKCCQIHRIF